MMRNYMQIDSRILRDMSDGVLVLDIAGTVLYMNDKGRVTLGLKRDPTGEKYATIFLDSEFQNDHFHQLVLDAVYDKDKSQTGIVPWHGNGSTKMVKLTASFLHDEEDNERIGVVVLFSDVTEVEKLSLQRRESSNIFASLMFLICIYLFFWSAARTYQWNIPLWVFSWCAQLIGCCSVFFALKTTSFSIWDMGLRLINAKTTIMLDIFIALGGAVSLIVLKMILSRVAPGFFPVDAPFFDWSGLRISSFYYPLTVVIQEFLARGAMQGSLQRIFTGKYTATLSILVSSLIFGVLHIAYGFPYMVGAAILLGFLGVLYNKQGHIWGICIIHFVLGWMAEFLRYTI